MLTNRPQLSLYSLSRAKGRNIEEGEGKGARFKREELEFWGYLAGSWREATPNLISIMSNIRENETAMMSSS